MSHFQTLSLEENMRFCKDRGFGSLEKRGYEDWLCVHKVRKTFIKYSAFACSKHCMTFNFAV